MSCKDTDFITRPGKRSHGGSEVDISSLPESAVHLILSSGCLTTKEVVRTSLLSKYWKDKWMTASKVIVSDDEFTKHTHSADSFYKIKSSGSFYEFMKNVLSKILKVNEFQLHCKVKHDPSQIAEWMSKVLNGGVETLHVSYNHKRLNLPAEIFNTGSLTNLMLKMSCTLRAPIYNHLPHLTWLHLEKLQIHFENSEIGTLRFSFPVLQTFELIKCKWFNVKDVEFCVPVLVEFIFRTPDYEYYAEEYSIKIVGSRLEKFESYGKSSQEFIVSESPVTCAKLLNCVSLHDSPLLDDYGAHTRALLKNFSSIENLMLSKSLMRAMALTTSIEVPPVEYYCLEHLVVECRMPDVLALFEVLNMAPHLNTLHLILKYDIGCLLDEDDDIDYNSDVDPESNSDSHYDSIPESDSDGHSDAISDSEEKDNYDEQPVPSCLLNFLEEIRFYEFMGETPHYHLAKYVIKNGMQLKKAYFIIIDDCVDEIERELSACPAGSESLTMFFRESGIEDANVYCFEENQSDS